MISDNEVEFCEDSFQAKWSQSTWSSAVQAELASVAAFDPRPYGSQTVENKQVYDHKSKQWRSYGISDYQAVVDPPPDELDAARAVFWTKGSGGVDMRPHIWDPVRK